MSVPADEFIRITFQIIDGDVFVEEVTVVDNGIPYATSPVVTNREPRKFNAMRFIEFLDSEHVRYYVNHLREIASASPDVAGKAMFMISFKLPKLRPVG